MISTESLVENMGIIKKGSLNDVHVIFNSGVAHLFFLGILDELRAYWRERDVSEIMPIRESLWEKLRIFFNGAKLCCIASYHPCSVEKNIKWFEYLLKDSPDKIDNTDIEHQVEIICSFPSSVLGDVRALTISPQFRRLLRTKSTIF